MTQANCVRHGVPRAAEVGELGQASALADEVFRPAKVVSMGDLFPSLWSEANASNVRVISDESGVVAHIGLWLSDVVLAGTRIPSASVGAVCSSPRVRGRGFGTALLLDAFAHCDSVGVDLITISGGRGLYTRNECRVVGQVQTFSSSARALSAPRAAGTDGVEADVRCFSPDEPSDMAEDAVAAIAAIHRGESIRFGRSLSDITRALRAATYPGVHDRRQTAAVAYRRGVPTAYVMAMGDVVDAELECYEHAGDGSAVLQCVYALASSFPSSVLRVSVCGWDTALSGLLALAGFRSDGMRPFAGTHFVTNPLRLFERLERYFQERMDSATAGMLARPTPIGDGRGLRLTVDGETLDLATRSSVIDAVLGGPATLAEGPKPAPGGRLAAALSAAFPLPFPNPECITYV